MKKIKLILAIMFFATLSLQSQNAADALRYSYLNYGGTARFMGMGGAFGALGGDFSSLSINPAGIGIFRGSEFTITPSLNYSLVNSNYYGVSDEDIKYSFNMKNIGFVFTVPISGSGEGSGLKSINFGFGLVQHNNFNYRMVAEGFNTESSLMTHFLNEANQNGLKPFTTQLAYDTWLLGTDDDGYFVDMPDGNVFQRMESNTSGYIQELVFSLGGNYNDVAYFGATIGIPSVRYEETFVFNEIDINNLSEEFNSLQYRETLTTLGKGFNFKLGGIFRIADIVRIGAAVHTPTFYQMEDEYKNRITSDLNLSEDHPTEASSPIGIFDYEINTPLRGIGSVGVVIGNRGIVSVDYEYANYASIRLRSDEYLFTEENRVIREDLREQHGVRLGGEFNLSPVFLRGGYAMYTGPVKTGKNDLSKTAISGGIGIRDKGYFIDFAYVYNIYNEDFYPYTNAAITPAEIGYSQSNFVLTLGLRW
jgi:hypothetical protein